MKRKAPSTPLVSKGLIDGVQSFKTDVKTLLKTPHGDPLGKKYRIQTSKGEEGGKHGDVFFVNLKDKSSDEIFAVKRQVIKSPKHLTDRSYRELLIFQNLNQLAVENKCVNFVEIIEWFKAMPNIMTPERRGKFVHNDLHLRNILLKTLPQDKKYLGMSDQGKTWVVEGYVVKLTDFGLSRITTKDGKVVYNPKSATTHAFTPASDVEKFYESLGSIKVDIQDATEKAALGGLKRLMRKGIPTRSLLNHDFFASLKERPTDCVASNSIFVNSAGQLLRDVTNTYLTPNNNNSIRLNPKVLPVDDVKRELTFSPAATPQKDNKKEEKKEEEKKTKLLGSDLSTLLLKIKEEEEEKEKEDNKVDKVDDKVDVRVQNKEEDIKEETKVESEVNNNEVEPKVETKVESKPETKVEAKVEKKAERGNNETIEDKVEEHSGIREGQALKIETKQEKKLAPRKEGMRRSTRQASSLSLSSERKEREEGLMKPPPPRRIMLKRGDSLLEAVTAKMTGLSVSEPQPNSINNNNNNNNYSNNKEGGELRRSSRLRRK